MLAVALAVCLLIAALVPALNYAANILRYRPPKPIEDAMSLPAVSVLIPARDEEDSIATAVASVLVERGVELEVVVLDDASTDQTAAIVREIAATDNRVRLEQSKPLPPGWCGKQFACWQLARLATHDRLLFLDADVRLEPDALPRTLAMFERLRKTSNVGLLSGVPRQIVGTVPEGLLIPLIHLVLLCYLPIGRMRRFVAPSYAAGCGQYLIVARDAYRKAGGHEAIRGSMHDGLMLPKAFRQAGIMTDLVDATPLARCRMYETGGEVWPGFSKNAAEGLAHPSRYWFFAIALSLGHIVPFVLLIWGSVLPKPVLIASLVGAAAALAVRIDMARRFAQPWSMVMLHPIAVAGLLLLQTVALVRFLLGRKPTWKGRGVTPEAA